MKSLIVILILVAIVLSGCASQKSLQIQKWHNSYLTTMTLRLETRNDELEDKIEAYIDSVKAVRRIARIIIDDRENLKSIARDFIVVTEESISDSILKSHGIAYELPDGRVIGR